MTKHEGTESQQELAQKLQPAILSLGALAAKFGETYRATWLNPEGTLESDTDHTVRLSLIACAVAADYDSRLNVGMVAQFATIHDLVEVYATDTPTLNAGKDVIEDKDAREALALQRIKSEFDEHLPWVSRTIEEYESQNTPEARFVKILDKVMPSISHLTCGFTMLRSFNIKTPEDVDASVTQTSARISKYVHDQPLAVAIRQAFIDEIKARISQENTPE